MAAPPIKSLRQAKDANEMTHEKRKVPVFMDSDDIAYLEQFPPSFWGKALAHRYNDKLFSTEKEASQGKKTNDIEDVILGNVMFKNINTGANKLHNKITQDVDDLAFTDMEKTPEHRDAYQGGHYGLDLKGAKKSKKHDLQFGEGYIGLSLKQAKNLLSQWKKGVNEGWLGKTKHLERKPIKKGAKERPVYSLKHLEKHPYRGKRFHVTEDGKAQWQGYRIDDDGNPSENPTAFTEYLEIMKPGVSVSRKAVRDHEKIRKVANTAHDQAEKVSQAIQQNPNMDLQDALEMAVGDEWKDYHAIIDPVTRDQLGKEYEDLKFRLDKQGPAKQGQNVSIRQQKKEKDRMSHIEHIIGLGDSFDKNFGKLDKQNLPVVLTWVGDELHKKADHIVKNAERYDPHDWNLHRFNIAKNDPKDPFSDYKYKKLSHHDAVGFGTFNTNKNQKERLHSSIIDQGVHPEKLRDELMPFLVQSGIEPASASAPDGDYVPYTLIPGTNEKTNSPLAIGINRFLRTPGTFGDSPAFIAMKNNWWQIFQNAADDLWGRIGSKEFVDFIDARNNKDENFVQAAFNNLVKFATTSANNYAKTIYQVTKRQQKKSLDEPVKGGQSLGDLLSQEDNKIQDATRKLAYNRSARSAESESHTTGHDIDELKKIIDKESELELKKIIDKESELISNVLDTSDPGGENKNNMMKNIIDTGVAFQTYRNYYIWNKIAEKKAKGVAATEKDDWDMQSANAYAAQQVKQHQVDKGIPAYGGQISAANSRSIKALSEKERQEEKGVRQRIADADAAVSSAENAFHDLNNAKTDDEKAKFLRNLFYYARTLHDPKTQEIARAVVEKLGPAYLKSLNVEVPNFGTPTQAQMTPAVNKMMKLSVNPRFLATLDKNAPQFKQANRDAFEQWVEHKYPGWEKINQALKRADYIDQRPTG
jgi:hypothetical protein